jgi:ATPase subunit of ABC transporter with duplicated ATPase domains
MKIISAEERLLQQTRVKIAIFGITYNRNFLNRVANSIFIVANWVVRQFSGDVDQYEKQYSWKDND